MKTKHFILSSIALTMALTLNHITLVLPSPQLNPKYQGLLRHITDLHMYNLIVVSDRVRGWHLPDDRPVCDYKDFNMKDILPSVDDNAILRGNWINRMGHILVKYLPELAWIEPYLQKTIPHQFMAESKKKTKVVSELNYKMYIVFLLSLSTDDSILL